MAIPVAVCGAKISCTGIVVPIGENSVTGTTDQQATGCNDSILTEADIVKDTNVFNFAGNCKFLPHPIGGGRFLPCQMKPSGGWKITAKGFGDTEERILKRGSRFACNHGGWIKIEDANQTHIDVGELGSLFENGYTVEDIESMLENGWTLEYLDAAMKVFEFSIDYKKVKFNANSKLVAWTFNRPFVWGNTILSSKNLSVRTAIHELMHVHQFQHHGWTYVTDSRRDAIDTRNDGSDFYVFDEGDLPATKLDDFYIEQQAEIAAHYYKMITYTGTTFPVTFQNINGNTSFTYKDREALDEAINETYYPIITEIRDSEADNWFEKQIKEEVSSTMLVGEAIYEGGEIAVEKIAEGGEIVVEKIGEGGEIVVEKIGEKAEEIERGLLDWVWSPRWGG